MIDTMRYAVEKKDSAEEVIFLIQYNIVSDLDESYDVEYDSITVDGDPNNVQIDEESDIWKEFGVEQDAMDVACYEHYVDNIDYDCDGDGYFRV